MTKDKISLQIKIEIIRFFNYSVCLAILLYHFIEYNANVLMALWRVLVLIQKKRLKHPLKLILVFRVKIK